MNFKRGEIYVKDYGDPFLVLATSKIGVTVLLIGKGNLWEQIPGLKIPGYGFAKIETVCTKSQKWINSISMQKVDKISFTKYKQIVDAIQSLFMGYISESSENGKLVYKDWDEESEIKPETEDVQEVKPEEKPIEAVEPQDIPTEEPSQESDLPENDGTLHTKYDDEADVPPDGFYDLLKGMKLSSKGYDNTSADPIPGIEDHHKRRWFSEIEVIAISCMPTDAVADKYSINYSQACYIIRNAKDIIGMDRTRTTKKYTYAKYFEQGFTAEEVAEIYPDKKCRVHQCYEQWWLNNKNVTEESQSAAIEKWKIPVTFMSELELANYVYHVNVYDFCRSEKCRTSVGGRLLRDIKRKQLAKNPLAVVGFNELAFGADLQTQYIINCRLALNEKGSASQTQIVDTIIYDEVIKVAKYYDESFSKHADILFSIEQIPSDIPTEDVPTYLMLIRNRFDLDVTNLTDEEINYIGFETYENIAKRFLFRKDKIDALKSYIKRKNKLSHPRA